MANEQGAGRGRGGNQGRGGGNQGAGENQQAAVVIGPMQAVPRHIPNGFENIVFPLFRKTLTKTDLKQLRFTSAANLEAFTNRLTAFGIIGQHDNKVTIDGVTLFLDGEQEPETVLMKKGEQHYYYINWKNAIADRFTLNQEVDVWAAINGNQVNIFVEHAI